MWLSGLVGALIGMPFGLMTEIGSEFVEGPILNALEQKDQNKRLRDIWVEIKKAHNYNEGWEKQFLEDLQKWSRKKQGKKKTPKDMEAFRSFMLCRISSIGEEDLKSFPSCESLSSFEKLQLVEVLKGVQEAFLEASIWSIDGEKQLLIQLIAKTVEKTCEEKFGGGFGEVLKIVTAAFSGYEDKLQCDDCNRELEPLTLEELLTISSKQCKYCGKVHELNPKKELIELKNGWMSQLEEVRASKVEIIKRLDYLQAQNSSEHAEQKSQMNRMEKDIAYLVAKRKEEEAKKTSKNDQSESKEEQEPAKAKGSDPVNEPTSTYGKCFDNQVQQYVEKLKECMAKDKKTARKIFWGNIGLIVGLIVFVAVVVVPASFLSQYDDKSAGKTESIKYFMVQIFKYYTLKTS